MKLKTSNWLVKMSKGTFALTILLLAVSAQAALAAGQLMYTAEPANLANASTTRQVARSFYLALDAAYSTGSVAPLDRLLAPDFIDHAPGSEAAEGRAELMHFAGLVHESDPTTRIRANSFEVSEGIARAAIVFESTTPLGQRWNAEETLRVLDGVIVERWRALFPLPVKEALARIPIGDTMLLGKNVAVLEMAPVHSGASAPVEILGPAALFVRAGSIVVQMAGDVRRVVSPEESLQLGPGERATLGPADDSFAGWLLVLRREPAPPSRYDHAEASSVDTGAFDQLLARKARGKWFEFGSLRFRIAGDSDVKPPSGWPEMTISHVILPPGEPLPAAITRTSLMLMIERGAIADYGSGDRLVGGAIWSDDPGQPRDWTADEGQSAVVLIVA